MTAKYVRMVDGYRYSQNENEISGQEQYIKFDDHAAAVDFASLPTIGSTAMLDPSGSAVGSCLCRGMEVVYRDQDINTPVYQFRFTTSPTSFQAINTDPAARQFTGGGEMTLVETKPETYFTQWTWTDGSKCEQAIQRRVILGSFTIPKGPMTTGEKNTWLGKVLTQAGTINNTTFEGFAEGQVLFESFTGGTSYTNGQLRWTFEMSFAYRLINDDVTSIGKDDWLYIFNADKAMWDKPKLIAGTAPVYLYKKTSLDDLK